jgi:hypothetical protein
MARRSCSSSPVPAASSFLALSRSASAALTRLKGPLGGCAVGGCGGEGEGDAAVDALRLERRKGMNRWSYIHLA